MKRVIVLLILLAGCHADNRIRTRPTLDYKIPPAKQSEYRLYVMRRLWAEKMIRDYENSQ
jgi:hypothetical protein